MKSRKKILVSVSTDLITDQRVSKVCSALFTNGYNVCLLGRLNKSSRLMESRVYSCKRFNLWFNKGFLFYANLNIRLFFFLLFHKSDALLANDLDTLPANYLVSKLKGIPLIYDSHEYFTEVPELENRKGVKRVWQQIELIILPKLKYAYTVSQKIADAYKLKYKTEFKLVRNFPVYQLEKMEVEKQAVIIYQGALNIGRGLEELIESMQFVEKAKLWIVGEGDIQEQLKLKTKELSLGERIKFYGRVEPKELKSLTTQARIGVSLEKKVGLNYSYALPNKIFDYLLAGVPVLYSDLEEVDAVLGDYSIGEKLQYHDPKDIATQLNGMLFSANYETWVANCEEAAKIFSWQEEEPVLLSIFDEAFSN